MATIDKVIKLCLSQKLRGAEPSISTICIGFVSRRIQKKYCRIHHAIVPAIGGHLKNGGHFQSNKCLSKKLGGAEPSIST